MSQIILSKGKKKIGYFDSYLLKDVYFWFIYLDDDDDGEDDREINNIATVNSMPCTGHYAKCFTCLITFSFHTTLTEGNHWFILQIENRDSERLYNLPKNIT